VNFTLKNFLENSRLNNFSHIYIERAAYEFPLTQMVRDRFPKAIIVDVDDYKTIFARPRQHFQNQKASMKLILAVKKDNFLYKGSNNSQNFNLENFYYNTPMLNCVYNCDYCYLQGMYPSANIVAFVNLEDYFSATQKGIKNRTIPSQPLYLCISYDTDLLAFESIIPYCQEWINFVQQQPELLVEIRTKSAAYHAIRTLQSSERVILAWTISPDQISRHYELGAPPFQQRLDAIKLAIEDGWPIRLCFDPVLAVPSWRSIYGKMFEETFKQIDPATVRDVTIGVFRMTKSYFQRLKKQRQDTPILFDNYIQEGSTMTYPVEIRSKITEFIRQCLKNYFREEQIGIWK